MSSIKTLVEKYETKVEDKTTFQEEYEKYRGVEGEPKEEEHMMMLGSMARDAAMRQAFTLEDTTKVMEKVKEMPQEAIRCLVNVTYGEEDKIENIRKRIDMFYEVLENDEASWGEQRAVLGLLGNCGRGVNNIARFLIEKKAKDQKVIDMANHAIHYTDTENLKEEHVQGILSMLEHGTFQERATYAASFKELYYKTTVENKKKIVKQFMDNIKEEEAEAKQIGQAIEWICMVRIGDEQIGQYCHEIDMYDTILPLLNNKKHKISNENGMHRDILSAVEYLSEHEKLNKDILPLMEPLSIFQETLQNSQENDEYKQQCYGKLIRALSFFALQDHMDTMLVEKTPIISMLNKSIYQTELNLVRQNAIIALGNLARSDEVVHHILSESELFSLLMSILEEQLDMNVSLLNDPQSGKQPNLKLQIHLGFSLSNLCKVKKEASWTILLKDDKLLHVVSRMLQPSFCFLVKFYGLEIITQMYRQGHCKSPLPEEAEHHLLDLYKAAECNTEDFKKLTDKKPKMIFMIHSAFSAIPNVTLPEDYENDLNRYAAYVNEEHKRLEGVDESTLKADHPQAQQQLVYNHRLAKRNFQAYVNGVQSFLETMQA